MNVSYIDTAVEPGITYYYKVSAVDKFNQESELSDAIEAIPFNDTTPPEVIGMEPIEGRTLGPKASIIVRAADNVKVSEIALQYQKVRMNGLISVQLIQQAMHHLTGILQILKEK